MFENEHHIAQLVAAYLKEELNMVQQAELDTWLQESEGNRIWFDNFCRQEELKSKLDSYRSVNSKAIWKRTASKIETVSPVAASQQPLRLWPGIAVTAAAAVVIVLGIWLYYASGMFGGRYLEGSEARGELMANDIKPGKNSASLILANGKTIELSDAKSGIVINANKLSYNDGTAVGSFAGEADKDQVMTITTPRGGTYQVTLPDGTNVWLNAASSLTYIAPLKERGGLRMVSLSGEAYFEVFKNKDQPFIVKSKNQEIEVLGTHFNVSAYENDGNIITSLLEGSVRVKAVNKDDALSDDAMSSVLKPNQQSILTGNVIKIREIDPVQPVAWKNGYFIFASESIQSIMKKISRWYDVDIDYQGKITKEGFTGSVSKYENVSEVLNTLELTGLVHFKIQGRRITVMP